MRIHRNFQIARRLLSRLGLCLTATCGLIVVGSTWPAFADEYDALNVEVGVDARYDSNIFSRASSLGPTADWIVKPYVGLRIDKPYAQQRFQLNATASAYRYDRFSQLDFNAFDYRAAWLWHLSPRVNGTLSALRTEAPTAFDDSIGVQRNILTNELYVFDVDGQVSGGWHGLAGYSYRKQKYDNPSVTAIPSYKADIGFIGVKYLFPSNNWISGVYRDLSGDYDSRIPNPVTLIGSGFTGYDAEASMNWVLTAKWELFGRLTYLDRKDENFSQRDYSGTAGEVRYTWKPAGKLRYVLGALRDLQAYQTSQSSYRVTDRLSAAGTWQAFPKTAYRFGVFGAKTDYKGRIAASSLPDRRDWDFNLGVGLQWRPTRGSLIDAGVAKRWRTSNDSFAQYDKVVVDLRATLTF